MCDQQNKPRFERMIGYPSHKYAIERVVEQSSGPKGKGRKWDPKTITIVLMGSTGAGKSTFASLASGRKDVVVGHGAEPCTQEPRAVNFELDGRPIVLIDTPGLNDHKRSDTRILEDIAQWVARKGYDEDGRPDGMVLLHPVTHGRAGASERNHTRLLERMLGPDACRRVMIATTMWDELATKTDVLDERVQDRVSEGGVWYDMCRQGAKVVKHHNTIESAHAIIRAIISIVDKEGRAEPLFHSDIREKEGRIADTLVGKELEKQILDKIAGLQKELKEHLARRPPDSFKRSKDPADRRDWKRWHKEHHYMAEDLASCQQELKKLRSIVVRFVSFLAGIFGGH